MTVISSRSRITFKLTLMCVMVSKFKRINRNLFIKGSTKGGFKCKNADFRHPQELFCEILTVQQKIHDEIYVISSILNFFLLLHMFFF